MKLNIEQLAEKVNHQLSYLSSNDKRFSNSLSVRRIRDYISKGILDKPFKNGKNIYFTELHYQKLIALREVQSEGISEENVKKIMFYENKNNEENTLKNDVLATINEINNKKGNTVSEAKLQANLGSNVIKENSENYFSSILNNATINKSIETKSYIGKSITKSWSEIPLLSNKVFFRIENNTTLSEEEKKEILKNIHQILGIQGE